MTGRVDALLGDGLEALADKVVDPLGASSKIDSFKEPGGAAGKEVFANLFRVALVPSLGCDPERGFSMIRSSAWVCAVVEETNNEGNGGAGRNGSHEWGAAVIVGLVH